MSEQWRDAARAKVRRGEPDDREPTLERQAKLRAVYEKNMAEGRDPYEGAVILTRGELTWVINESDWLMAQGGEMDDTPIVNLSGVNLSIANLSDVNLDSATLAGARFEYANLSRAVLFGADLSSADLRGATVNGADLRATSLRGADLREVHMDADTRMADAVLDTRTRLVDVVWNGAPVTRLNWQDIAMLGDETEARDPTGKWPSSIIRMMRSFERASKRRSKRSLPLPLRTEPASVNSAHLGRLFAFEDAVLANRQVVSVLRGQGLNESSDRFAYRAQSLQRRVLWLQRHYLRAFGSLILDLISGYGYRPMRSLIAYVVIILAFAGAYLLNAQFAAPHLTWDEALVLSISSFHGRGFFTSGISLGDTVARLAAGEAIIGLLIEITFIATFTQRFFAR